MGEELTLLVDYPGYWLDGEIVTGRLMVLDVGKRRWSLPPKTGGEQIECYLVKHSDIESQFGIPTNRVVVVKDPPVLDLRGMLGEYDRSSSSRV